VTGGPSSFVSSALLSLWKTPDTGNEKRRPRDEQAVIVLGFSGGKIKSN
jgi:hypothetical protein